MHIYIYTFIFIYYKHIMYAESAYECRHIMCMYIYNINICILRCICMILYYMHRFLRPCMNMNMRPPQDVHFPLQI